VVAVAVVVAAACRGGARPPDAAAVPPTPAVAARPLGDSNVRAADYVGPAVCGECHLEQHARWSASLHAVMNQRADAPGAVIGDFAGARLRYGDGEAVFGRDGAAYTMTLRRGARATRYRVTRTIGRRALQEYVGIADDDPAHTEVRLPFGWWVRRGGWYPQAFFDPWLAAVDHADGAPGDDPFAPVREPWAARCPWCHSTYPFALRIARSDALHVGHGLEQGVSLGGGAAGDPAAARGVLAVEAQVTPGISCESCHLGGRAHVAAALAGAEHPPIHLAPQGVVGAPAAATFAVERTRAAVVDAVCTQCHSGPSPRLPDGSALRNSSEGLDLAASSCVGARCTDCHDPHRGGARVDDTARALAACVRCHVAFADPAVARGHAGHDATTCLDCHMPRLVQGVERVVRSHRISSPTDPAMLAAAAPNACNLCHLDRGIAWTLRELARGWHARIAPTAAWTAAYGRDLEAPLGPRWLAGASPQLAIVAAFAYARSPLGPELLPTLRSHLADRRPWVRTWMLMAIEDLTGRPVAGYDPRARAR
jgi:hypothetical protein